MLARCAAAQRLWAKRARARRHATGLCGVPLVIALLIVCWAGHGQALDQRHLYATSSEVDPAGRAYIVLHWTAAENVIGYNLYRKEATARTYPSLPVNGRAMIMPVDTCAALRAIIPERSEEWRMLHEAFRSLLPDDAKRTDAVDPCTVIARGPTAEEEAILELLGELDPAIRQVRGLAFIDHAVVPGARYHYELRGVRRGGEEIVLGPEVGVEVGVFELPAPPEGLTAIAGDNSVLCLWERNDEAHSYVVRRISPYLPFPQIISAQAIVFDVTEDLDGNALDPRPGFVDYRRWDEDGFPSSHVVDGVTIFGPENGKTYHYQVASCDILGRTGDWSEAQSATPVDLTPPKAPTRVAVDPLVDPATPGLVVSWRKVTHDIDGHRELDTAHTYLVYRADSLEALDDPEALSAYLVHSLTADPTDSAIMTLSWTDTDPAIIPEYGEKDFWYRVRCVDGSPQGNMSAPSAAISGRVPDTTPPGPTRLIRSEGYAEHITIMWEPNPEPDLGGYQIYRSICDFGVPYRPEREVSHDVAALKEFEPVYCDFVLVGELLVAEARKRLNETGAVYFEDHALPEGSPICYAYWVRAFDMARNLYPGVLDTACPDKGEYLCQRLYEETPPPAPIISGLQARSNAVLIEWVSSPVQDIRAFHVYRSTEETGPPAFIACVFIDGAVSTTPWTGIQPSCEEIPAEPDPTALFGTFTDKGVEPHREYWYRVAGVDWLGNESEHEDITAIPAISTFTYSTDLPRTPEILEPSPGAPTGCGLVVRWAPSFDSREHIGFIVYRSTAPGGPYRQVSPVVRGNAFADETAIRGVDYWYRVQAMDHVGKLSEPSTSVRHSY